MTGPQQGEQKALILAPQGRDAEVAASLLGEAGLASTVCTSVQALAQALADDILFAVVTAETMRSADLRSLAAWVAAQPSWSGLPFVVLTHHGGGLERNPDAARLSELLENVTFLERPFHPTTFISMARNALKSRQRQYEARASIEELRALTETLEDRVAERTTELERAHATVLEEIGQRERAEEKLRQSLKMEAIGKLTGGIAHDFNNLLMAVLGNLDLLRKHMLDDPKAARLIDGAMQGAERGAALTQRLLAFSRQQDLQVAATDLVALVRGMSDLLKRSVGPEIEMRTDLPEGLPPALVDANQLELALLNLVVNARDAMPDGGVVTIGVDRATPPAALDLGGEACLRLAVTDTGHGMDERTLRRAVEPFFSTKELGKGTGLGLSMVHGLAVQMRGALRLESEPRLGTKAELWLREAVGPVVARTAPAPARKAEDRLEPATILVVDDDALIAMSTVDMLEDLGHRVLEANSGARALELLGNGHTVDLLITDYSMPGMTGVQLAEAARAVRPNLPILLASGYADLPAGSSIDLPRIAKPYQQDQLARELSRLLV